MRRTLNAQTCGSVIVIATFIASEASAQLLAARPGSAFAWYVNLEWFRPFEAARVEASPLRLLFGPFALSGALIVLGLALLAWQRRSRFGVALIANLSFVFSATLASTWLEGRATHEAASLAPLFVEPGSSAAVIEVMLAASFLGFCLSHTSFIGAILAQSRARRGAENAAPVRILPARSPQRAATGEGCLKPFCTPDRRCSDPSGPVTRCGKG